jgi:plastocyanin
MNTKLLVGLVVLALGVGVGWYVLQNNKTSTGVPPATDQAQQAVTTPEPTVQAVSDQANPTGAMQGTEKGAVPSTQATAKTTVSYTDSGFTPNSVTVKQGATVTFVNNSAKGMWVASDVHPTHQLLPGFDELKSVQKGGSYDYTFVKVGTWTFHNHMSPSEKGTVVVTQ